MTRTQLLAAAALGVAFLAAGCPRQGPDLNDTTPTGTATRSVTPASVGALNLAYAGMPANSWVVGSPMAHERVGPSAGMLGDRLYAIGGDGEATMELYDPATDSWRLLPLATSTDPSQEAFPPNRARYFGAAVTSGGRLFYVGGTTNSLMPMIDLYDPNTHAWLDLWSPYLVGWPYARMAHAAVNLDEVLYVIGGLMEPATGGSPAPTAEVYAVSTIYDETYLKADMPSARAGLGAAVFDHRILVTGGYGALPATGSAEATSSTLCYALGEWTTQTPLGEPLAAMNVPRHSFGSAVLNGKWYVAGGMDSAGRVLDSVEEYDPATNTWRLEAPMPSPRVHLALGAVGDRLFALGGYDDRNRQLRSVDVFRP